MASDHHHLRPPYRLHGSTRAMILFVTTLALAIIVGLIWSSVAHPQADSVRLLDLQMIGGPAGIRRMTAWLLAAACGLVAVTGILLLAMDRRAGRLAGHRLGKHVRQR